jgi:hypothetical protein
MNKVRFGNDTSEGSLKKKCLEVGGNMMIKSMDGSKKFGLSGRESNPGLPRDRRRYSPLYYRRSQFDGFKSTEKKI